MVEAGILSNLSRPLYIVRSFSLSIYSHVLHMKRKLREAMSSADSIALLTISTSKHIHPHIASAMIIGMREPFSTVLEEISIAFNHARRV